MKIIVLLAVFSTLAAGCVSRAERREEAAEVGLEQAEARLAEARASGDAAAAAAAEAEVSVAKEKLARAAAAAQKELEARQAFWTGIIGLGIAGVRVLAGVAAKGATGGIA